MSAIEISQVQAVLEVKMQRPERKNALTAAMYGELADALDRAAQDTAIRAVLISGSDGNFSTGNDLSDFLNNPPSGPKDPVFRFLKTLADFPKPLVCAVEGYAVGVGTTLLLHADLVYADSQAKFQLPFVKLGLVPEAASSYLLPQLIGHLRASELLLLGETFSAADAEKYGVINAALASGVLEHARSKAQALAAQPPEAVRQAKALLKDAHRSSIQKQMDTEGELFMQLLRSPEVVETLKSFFTRKKS